MEEQVQFQASPFVRGNTDCDNYMVKGKDVPMHEMKAYRVEQRYISAQS